jgi:serine/threonine protein kinase
MWAKWRGALSSDDSSSLSSEHPTALKVRSPDRLAGDLFFLDASLLFTAEELSHAPAEILGRSSHGTSYKATLENGHMLTVKWLRAGLAKNKKEFTREAKRFGGIKHAHVMPMRGYYWGPREHEKLLLSDYISTGSLANHLYERSGRRYPTLTWEQRLQIAVGIASGLTYLHGKPGLAHGNLKSSNVLLQGPQLHARLVDYGLHHLMTATGTANHILNAGSLGYRSPELAATRKPKPSLAGDVYALGVILMELLTGKGAGDIVSADSGAVDLPDWVRLVVSEGRPAACFDPALVGVHRDQEPPKGMHEVLTIALLCIAPHAMRPNVRVVYDQLASISS